MTGKRILVVEDHPLTLMNESEMLREMGHAVVCVAYTGEDAITRAGEKRPDVVLMDIQLIGDMDGRQAAQEIRKRNGTPVVFVTACGDKSRSSADKVNTPEGYGYIVKPFSKGELSREPNRVLGGQEG